MCEDFGRRLNDRGGRGQNVGTQARARRIDAAAVDHLLRFLRGDAGGNDPSIPPHGVKCAGWSEIENRHILVDAQRKQRRADEVSDHVVAGEATHGPAMLTGHNRRMPRGHFGAGRVPRRK